MKTNYKIESTTNYALFVAHEYQQRPSAKRVQKIAASMLRNGFLPSKPIQVYEKNGKLNIIDGHHRAGAAQLAGVPALYVVEPESRKNLIGEFNETQGSWRLETYIRLNAGKGNTDAITLLNYMEKGIPCSLATALLAGNSAASTNHSDAVKDGTYKVKTTRIIDDLLAIMDTDVSPGLKVKESCPAIKLRSYIHAIGVLLTIPQFSVKQFIKRLSSNPRALTKCATTDQALQVIEEIYNYRSQIEEPLALLARAKMKNNNPIKKKDA